MAADPARALAMDEEGCRMADIGSCVARLQKGKLLPPPPDEAAQLREAACANGVPQACP